MKLEFCAVCGSTESLQQHHIEPVVYTRMTRKGGRKRPYDKNTPLQYCSASDIFLHLEYMGVISEAGEITVCGHHHMLLHGIVRYHKNTHSEMIKHSLRLAKEQGKKLGRPSNITPEVPSLVRQYRALGWSIHKIAKHCRIGVGSTRKILGLTS